MKICSEVVSRESWLSLDITVLPTYKPFARLLRALESFTFGAISTQTPSGLHRGHLDQLSLVHKGIFFTWNHCEGTRSRYPGSQLVIHIGWLFHWSMIFFQGNNRNEILKLDWFASKPMVQQEKRPATSAPLPNVCPASRRSSRYLDMAGHNPWGFWKKNQCFLDLPNKGNNIHTKDLQHPNWDLTIYIIWIYPPRIPAANRSVGWDSGT